MRMNTTKGVFEISRLLLSTPDKEAISKASKAIQYTNELVGGLIWLHETDEDRDWFKIMLYPEDIIDLWATLNEKRDDLELCRDVDGVRTTLRVTNMGQFEITSVLPEEAFAVTVDFGANGVYQLPLLISWLEVLIDRYVDPDLRPPVLFPDIGISAGRPCPG